MERYAYFDGGKWRLKIGDTEYSGDWVERLAAYEETGLEPEDMKKAFNEDATLKLAGQILGVTPGRLRELAQAENKGTCGIPPVRLHQHIFRVFNGAIKEEIVCNAMWEPFAPIPRWRIWVLGGGLPYYWADVFSKTVFLTREAAEAALKEREAIQNVLDKQDKG